MRHISITELKTEFRLEHKYQIRLRLWSCVQPRLHVKNAGMLVVLQCVKMRHI
jgi:hypothetical protein